MARLAGADCARFAAAAAWLRAHGLAAPDIYAADHGQGFVILEDLGEALFAEVLAEGGDEKKLYEAAVEVLARIHANDAPGCAVVRQAAVRSMTRPRFWPRPI